MPNFLIIGAAKAGTTSLYSYLKQHPQIYMSPIKEPRFFALEGEKLDFRGPTQSINQTSVTTLAEYHQLFQEVTTETAIGEASTVYLSSPKAPERIKHHLPDVKLIAILRDPSERAFSSYTHLVRDGYETLSFTEAIAAEAIRIEENWQPLWYYQKRGFYYQQLQRYLELFKPEQIKIYLYEDLAIDSAALIQDVTRFLGVDDTFTPDSTRKNVSGIPKNRLLQNLLTKKNPIKSVLKPLLPEPLRQSVLQSLTKSNLGAKPTLSSEMRQKLIAIYREDILKLQDLIHRDLSQWLIP
ncbi:MAG TPA: sulfotransferase [Xenococcaceae cyanobacterium]